MSLAVSGVTHRYERDAAPVLRDVSLSIEAGTSIALMGPSGSGKTTLLGVFGLLFAPSEGAVLLDGTPITGRDATRLRAEVFGWVFQGTNVLPRRTALENAALGLLARGFAVAPAHAAAGAALDAVGIGHLAGQPANTLSGGELQRVCIARAIAVEPRFILADEPTGQLDSATTVGVIEALVSNRPARSSVIIATHDPEVARCCDRVVHIRDGQLVEAAGLP